MPSKEQINQAKVKKVIQIMTLNYQAVSFTPFNISNLMLPEAAFFSQLIRNSFIPQTLALLSLLQITLHYKTI